MQKSGLTVISVEFVDEEIEVFDIEVETDHSFMVGGAVLHNCMSCASMDGKTWTMDESHPIPSLHWNCRCLLIPETKTFQQLAKEAHGNSSIAKHLDEIEPGTRASMGGPVSGDLKYEDWLMSQSEARQKAILGKGKFELFQKGKIGFTDLVNQTGNPLTLKELEALN